MYDNQTVKVLLVLYSVVHTHHYYSTGHIKFLIDHVITKQYIMKKLMDYKKITR